MIGSIVSIFVGIVCIVLGIFNTKGNIDTLHSYHVHRVTEENRLPFGRLVGTGTIVMGAAIVVFGGLSAVALLTNNSILGTVGTVIMTVGIIVGLGLSFYAMIKYNKGIF